MTETRQFVRRAQMLQRIFGDLRPIAGTLTMRRSVFLKMLRRAHPPRLWEYVHVTRDGYEYRCVQCGHARFKLSGKRCRDCYFDNSVVKFFRPGGRGEVIACLLEGEAQGMFQMIGGKWCLSNYKPTAAVQRALQQAAAAAGSTL